MWEIDAPSSASRARSSSGCPRSPQRSWPTSPRWGARRATTTRSSRPWRSAGASARGRTRSPHLPEAQGPVRRVTSSASGRRRGCRCASSRRTATSSTRRLGRPELGDPRRRRVPPPGAGVDLETYDERVSAPPPESPHRCPATASLGALRSRGRDRRRRARRLGSRPPATLAGGPGRECPRRHRSGVRWHALRLPSSTAAATVITGRAPGADPGTVVGRSAGRTVRGRRSSAGRDGAVRGPDVRQPSTERGSEPCPGRLRRDDRLPRVEVDRRRSSRQT